ncbi:hypothetical protein TWF696_002608 [Orbilia brochopaga]|uniref:Uncharacterized protein n=1 Tax=Orbilia brochopaga TaxID=3140254 RepID=A0AAV9U406_9PEZI
MEQLPFEQNAGNPSFDAFDSSADSTDDETNLEDQLVYGMDNCSPAIGRFAREIDFLQNDTQNNRDNMEDDIALAFGSPNQGDSLEFNMDEIQNGQMLFEEATLVGTDASDPSTNNCNLDIAPCLLTPPLSLSRSSHESIGLESLGLPGGRAQPPIELEQPKHKSPESSTSCRLSAKVDETAQSCSEARDWIKAVMELNARFNCSIFAVVFIL